MAEVKTQVKTYEVQYVCDVCKDGYMEPNGIMLTSNPPKYQHSCQNCNHSVSFRVQYPRMVYEPILFENISDIGK